MKKAMKKRKMTEEQRETWFEAVRDNDIETIKKMLEEGINVNLQDSSGWTALHYTNNIKHLKMAKLLINNGADVNIQNENFKTPLHRACTYASYWGNTEMAKFLIENGADITIKEKYGDTPLDRLKRSNLKRYEELTAWLTEYYPEKMLELMASENIQSNGIEL